MHYTKKIVALWLLSTALTACNNNEKKPLPGLRLPVSQIIPMPQVDPTIATATMSPPAPSSSSSPYPVGNAITSSSGKLKHKFKVHTDSYYGLTKPTFSENNVYILTSKGELLCYNLQDGKLQWKNSNIAEDNRQVEKFGGITYHQGKLFVTAGTTMVLAVDAASGATLWKKQLSAITRAVPSYADGAVIIEAVNKNLFALQADSGQIKWSYWGTKEADASAITSITLPYWHGMVFSQQGDGDLVALNATNGDVAHTIAFSDSMIGKYESVSTGSSQLLIDSDVAYVLSGLNQALMAVELASNKRMWQIPLNNPGNFWLAGDLIFCVTNNKQLLAIHKTSGKIKWQTALPSVLKKRKKTADWLAPSVINGQVVLARTDGMLYHYSYDRGELLTSKKMAAQLLCAPIVYNKQLFLLEKSGVKQFS